MPSLPENAASPAVEAQPRGALSTTTDVCMLTWCNVVKVANTSATPKAKIKTVKTNRGPITGPPYSYSTQPHLILIRGLSSADRAVRTPREAGSATVRAKSAMHSVDMKSRVVRTLAALLRLSSYHLLPLRLDAGTAASSRPLA
jgi:hypothetical protein